MLNRKKNLGTQSRPEQFATLQVPERIGRWLIPYTLSEVLHLIWSVVWQQVRGTAHTVAWSLFRRHHQAVAQLCHYKRHLAPNTS
ncbi:MAG TPA: hypothetical protein VFV38_23240 [Ktedonobacteraceae bacterium]|nr:hypothetical protein [Ktedonobacteraceae bacterium]